MDTYFVRSRGKLAGPFAMDALQQLVKRGKVTRFDHVSPDKASWRSAGDIPELFAPAAPRQAPAMVADEPLDDGIALHNDTHGVASGYAAAGPGHSFFYAQNGAAVGPVPLSVLQTLATNGTLRAEDPVWADGSDIATPARQVPMLASFYSGRNSAPYTSASGARDAGFWLRVVASILDGLITIVITFVVAFGIGMLIGFIGSSANMRRVDVIDLATACGGVVQFVLPWLYHAFLESSEAQSTLGKRCLGLIVTGPDGERITFMRATGRYFGKIVSALILGVGFIMAAFTPRKQALHDMMASTYVLQK